MSIRKSKNITTISLVTIFAICFILVIMRWISIFNEDIFVISNEINSHITNLTLSLMTGALIGYLILCFKKKYLSIIILGFILICINIIYETLLPFLNTIDFIDALYGIAGVILSMAYLFTIDKRGFE